jgi:hypothetical protein
VKVFGNWSACMTVAGFRYSDLLKSYGDAVWAKSRCLSAWALKEFGPKPPVPGPRCART